MLHAFSSKLFECAPEGGVAACVACCKVGLEDAVGHRMALHHEDGGFRPAAQPADALRGAFHNFLFVQTVTVGDGVDDERPGFDFGKHVENCRFHECRPRESEVHHGALQFAGYDVRYHQSRTAGRCPLDDGTAVDHHGRLFGRSFETECRAFVDADFQKLQCVVSRQVEDVFRTVSSGFGRCEVVPFHAHGVRPPAPSHVVAYPVAFSVGGPAVEVESGMVQGCHVAVSVGVE